jgi:hypothetical protein
LPLWLEVKFEIKNTAPHFPFLIASLLAKASSKGGYPTIQPTGPGFDPAFNKSLDSVRLYYIIDSVSQVCPKNIPLFWLTRSQIWLLPLVDYCQSTYLKILKKKGEKKTKKSYFRAINIIINFYLLEKEKEKKEGSLSYVVPTFVMGKLFIWVSLF